MKHFWYLICIIFPLHGAAQINIRIDYDNTSKEITLFLKNETNRVFKFIPIEGTVYEYVSSISFLYLKSATIIQYTIKGRFMSR